jgi:hypothetical protein
MVTLFSQRIEVPLNFIAAGLLAYVSHSFKEGFWFRRNGYIDGWEIIQTLSTSDFRVFSLRQILAIYQTKKSFF